MQRRPIRVNRFTARRGRAGWAVLILGAFITSIAQAVIPLPERTLKAIAAINRSSGRTQALQLELSMRIGNEPPIATAELISHPSGLARLEIRGFDGRVDRYLLTGSELAATMNGKSLSRPRPILQPYFLLQPESTSTLRTGLETFGVRTESIGLAPCGELDCFVFGDPRLEAPLERPIPDADEGDFEDFGLDAESREPPPASLDLALRDPAKELVIDGALPRFWVDTQELQVQRIDRADGFIVIFGPVATFDRIKVPSWFEIHDPDDAFPMRFEVDRAVQVNAPPGAFDRGWLIPPDLEDGSRR